MIYYVDDDGAYFKFAWDIFYLLLVFGFMLIIIRFILVVGSEIIIVIIIGFKKVLYVCMFV